MSTYEEKCIKKFIDTSCVKWIISEEATAGVLEKSVLKNSFSEVCHMKFSFKVPEKYLYRKDFLVKLQVINL